MLFRSPNEPPQSPAQSGVGFRQPSPKRIVYGSYINRIRTRIFTHIHTHSTHRPPVKIVLPPTTIFRIAERRINTKCGAICEMGGLWVACSSERDAAECSCGKREWPRAINGPGACEWMRNAKVCVGALHTHQKLTERKKWKITLFLCLSLSHMNKPSP